MHKNGTYIVFVQMEPESLSIRNNRQGAGLNHIAFKIKSQAQLSEIKAELERRKVSIFLTDDEHICFEDPNGFAVEIFCWIVSQFIIWLTLDAPNLSRGNAPCPKGDSVPYIFNSDKVDFIW